MTKRNKIAYWVFTIWLALGMTSTGIVQLIGARTGAGAADSVAHLGYPLYLLTLLGICKLLGVLAILLPRRPLLKEWAYAGFFFMMAGAVYSHIVSGSRMGEVAPAMLLLALTLLSWYLRPADRKIQPTVVL